MEKEKEASDRLTFGSHVDFSYLHPVNAQQAKKQSARVDEKLEKYREEK